VTYVTLLFLLKQMI